MHLVWPKSWQLIPKVDALLAVLGAKLRIDQKQAGREEIGLARSGLTTGHGGECSYLLADERCRAFIGDLTGRRIKLAGE